MVEAPQCVPDVTDKDQHKGCRVGYHGSGFGVEFAPMHQDNAWHRRQALAPGPRQAWRWTTGMEAEALRFLSQGLTDEA